MPPPQDPDNEPIAPWYLKPAVLVLWGVLVACLLAMVIWGVLQLAGRDADHPTPATTVVTTTVAPAPVTTTTATTTSTGPTTTTPQATDTSEPATSAPTGRFHRPHLPTEITLPPLPSRVDIPHRH